METEAGIPCRQLKRHLHRIPAFLSGFLLVLESFHGYKMCIRDRVMTRESDTGLYKESDSHKKSADMKKRCQIIDEAEPILAVSIHQNSYHQEEISGAQVFYYKNSEKGQRLAEILQKRFDYVLGEAENRCV